MRWYGPKLTHYDFFLKVGWFGPKFNGIRKKMFFHARLHLKSASYMHKSLVRDKTLKICYSCVQECFWTYRLFYSILISIFIILCNYIQLYFNFPVSYFHLWQISGFFLIQKYRIPYLRWDPSHKITGLIL